MLRNLLVLCCVSFLQHVTNGTGKKGVNLAIRKRATQSSTHHHTTVAGYLKAAFAVDGDINDVIDGIHTCSCSHTATDDLREAWWEVDLLKWYRIGDIKILNRLGLEGRLHDFEIDVYETREIPRRKKNCITYAGAAGSGWTNLSCEFPVTGRYVRITKPKRNNFDVLTLCEVEIYEAPDINKEEQRSVYIFRRMSVTVATRPGDEVMARSHVHCASICAVTSGCQAIVATRIEDGRIRCHVLLDYPQKTDVKMRGDTTVYHLC